MEVGAGRTVSRRGSGALGDRLVLCYTVLYFPILELMLLVLRPFVALRVVVVDTWMA